MREHRLLGRRRPVLAENAVERGARQRVGQRGVARNARRVVIARRVGPMEPPLHAAVEIASRGLGVPRQRRTVRRLGRRCANRRNRADTERACQSARHADARAGLVAADALLAGARLAFAAGGAGHAVRPLAAGAAEADVGPVAVGVGGARRLALAVAAADIGIAGLLGARRADARAVAAAGERHHGARARRRDACRSRRVRPAGALAVAEPVGVAAGRTSAH